jgi:hypothetical protein
LSCGEVWQVFFCYVMDGVMGIRRLDLGEFAGSKRCHELCNETNEGRRVAPPRAIPTFVFEVAKPCWGTYRAGIISAHGESYGAVA